MGMTRVAELPHEDVDELLARVRARRSLPPAAERRRIREAAGVSQRELARALGVSWTAVYRWEQGSRPRTHAAEYGRVLAELKTLAPETRAPALAGTRGAREETFSEPR